MPPYCYPFRFPLKNKHSFISRPQQVLNYLMVLITMYLNRSLGKRNLCVLPILKKLYFSRFAFWMRLAMRSSLTSWNKLPHEPQNNIFDFYTENRLYFIMLSFKESLSWTWEMVVASQGHSCSIQITMSVYKTHTIVSKLYYLPSARETHITLNLSFHSLVWSSWLLYTEKRTL